LAIEIIEQILSKIDLNSGVAANGQLLVHKNEFRTHLELFLFKINWVDFPGLQNLLLKGELFKSVAYSSKIIKLFYNAFFYRIKKVVLQRMKKRLRPLNDS
jgi:hypothetical protein